MKASKKYIISIWEFMENYYGVIYDGSYKLTHDELSYYLRDKKSLPVKRSSFKDAKDEDLLNGNIILVKDEVGKVIPYYNPHRLGTVNVEEMFGINDYPLSLGYSNDLKSIGRYDYYVHEQKKKKILSKKKRVLRRKYD